jgi:toxin-antitoxin system PIN domain toxin
MILVDANLLVYAHVEGLPQHAAAREWLDEQLTGSAQVGLPWPSLLAFARLVSNPRVFERPLTVAEAWKQVERWLDATSAWIPMPSARHGEILAEIIGSGVIHRATLLPDAHLAALALEHGLVLCSADSDFARFPALRWQNPLQPAG